MNDYHNFYLGDAFEKVINSNLRNHGLCTSHLLSKAINIQHPSYDPKKKGLGILYYIFRWK